MRSDSGLALISALLLLAFLTLVGGAFLSTATVDTMIAGNYAVHARLQFLAEGGIEEAREALRISGVALLEELLRAAGPDGRLEPGGDLDSLLATDDRPLLFGEAGGLDGAQAAWYVFLRNDVQDGADQAGDTNGIVTLVGFARIGERTRRVEADVTRRVPPVAAALTLAGRVGTIGGGGEARIVGSDFCGRGDRHSIGLVRDEDVAALVDEIPVARQADYPGTGPLPDIANVAGPLPGYLESVAGLDRLTGSFTAGATDTFGDSPAMIANLGSREDPRVVVARRDAVLGPGTGYGVLLVGGEARVMDGFLWNGLVLVVGQGRLRWEGRGEVYGAVFVARSRGDPTPGEPFGPLLAAPGDIDVDFSASGGGIGYDSCVLEEAYRALPLSPIAFRNY